MIPWFKSLRWLRQWWLQAEGSWWHHIWSPNWGDYHPWAQTGTQALPLSGVTGLAWQGSPDDPTPTLKWSCRRFPLQHLVTLLKREATNTWAHTAPPDRKVGCVIPSQTPFPLLSAKIFRWKSGQMILPLFLSLLLHNSEHIPIIPQGTVVLEKTLESPLDCQEIRPVHSKGNQPWIVIGRTDAEAEAPILWPPHAKSWLIGKDLEAGSAWGQEEKGTAEDEMVGWHHRLNGHEFGWTSEVGDGQGGLACCYSWDCKESDTTERLKWTELKIDKSYLFYKQ